jgi:hypothetical protein
MPGFSKLRTVEVKILIMRAALTSLADLTSLERLGELSLYYVPITTLQGINPLENLHNVYLSGTALQDLSGLEFVTQLYGLSLSENPALSSLAGLENVAFVDQLYLSWNPVLSNIELPSLGEVATLILAGNPQVEHLRGLPALTHLDGLELTEQPGLTSLEGLEAVIGMDGVLRLSENANLASLRALASVDHARALLVENNPKLPTCEAEWLRDNIGVENIVNPYGDAITISGNDDAGTCVP